MSQTKEKFDGNQLCTFLQIPIMYVRMEYMGSRIFF